MKWAINTVEIIMSFISMEGFIMYKRGLDVLWRIWLYDKGICVAKKEKTNKDGKKMHEECRKQGGCFCWKRNWVFSILENSIGLVGEGVTVKT